jgi:hypothetical protein
MQIAIIITGLAIVLFSCLYLGFRTGLRLGMQTAKGVIPPKIRPPMQAIREIIEGDAEDKIKTDLMAGYANMMAYNGDIPKEEVK